jgi:FMN phosphatase YigB (HAD superfamily)
MKIIAYCKNPRCLIFDIDQTLYDNHEYYDGQKKILIAQLAQQRGKSFEEMVREVDEKQAAYAGSHDGKKLSLGNLFLRFGISLEENCRWRSDFFEPEKYLARDERLIGVMEILSGEYAITAVTNNTRDIAHRTLRVLGVGSFFHPVIGLDQTLVSKPTFKPFARAAGALGIPYTRCISIGDRFEVDIEVPVQEGMGGILVESMEDIYTLPEVLQTFQEKP